MPRGTSITRSPRGPRTDGPTRCSRSSSQSRGTPVSPRRIGQPGDAVREGRGGGAPGELARRALEAYGRVLGRWPAPPTDENFRVYIAALANTCDVLIDLRRLDDALESCTRATELEPKAPLPFYNLAAVHALRGDADRAIASPRRDLDNGDTEWEWLEQDPWFASLRHDRRFREVVAAMKTAAEKGETRGGGWGRVSGEP